MNKYAHAVGLAPALAGGGGAAKADQTGAPTADNAVLGMAL